MKYILGVPFKKTDFITFLSYNCFQKYHPNLIISTQGKKYYSFHHEQHNLKHPKYIFHNAQKRSSGKLSIHLFETYKNDVRPHGCHIYNYTVNMAMIPIFTRP